MIKYLILVFTTFVVEISIAQSVVSEIHTDYNGYDLSTVSSPTSREVSTQHLLAFKVNGEVYSTGVNDAVLGANNVTFSQQEYHAMPGLVFNSVMTSSSFIGMGIKYGGNSGSSGCSPEVTLPFGYDYSKYLSDGINGLDLSTAVFNVSGTLMYSVSDITPASIGDGIPDIIITQVGSVSSELDVFKFVDNTGATVGVPKGVVFNGIDVVSKPKWKFFRINTRTCGGAVAGDRELRLIAYEFSDLGITEANYQSITHFSHALSGSSDVAFVAYNKSSLVVLPSELSKLNATSDKRNVNVEWTAYTSKNVDYFQVQRSTDGNTWENIGDIKAVNGVDSKDYKLVDYSPVSGVSYYRLLAMDFDGNYSLSNPVLIKRKLEDVVLFPNPANDKIMVKGEFIEFYSMTDVFGKVVKSSDDAVIINNSSIEVNIIDLVDGYYLVQTSNGIAKVLVQK